MHIKPTISLYFLVLPELWRPVLPTRAQNPSSASSWTFLADAVSARSPSLSASIGLLYLCTCKEHFAMWLD